MSENTLAWDSLQWFEVSDGLSAKRPWNSATIPGRHCGCHVGGRGRAILKDKEEKPPKTSQTRKVRSYRTWDGKSLTSKTTSKRTHLRAFQKLFRTEKAKEVWV